MLLSKADFERVFIAYENFLKVLFKLFLCFLFSLLNLKYSSMLEIIFQREDMFYADDFK